VDYISKLVDDIPTISNDAKMVAKFFRGNVFARFGMPRAIISDHGTKFTTRYLDALLRRFLIVHRLATPYNSEISGQVEVSNK